MISLEFFKFCWLSNSVSFSHEQCLFIFVVCLLGSCFIPSEGRLHTKKTCILFYARLVNKSTEKSACCIVMAGCVCQLNAGNTKEMLFSQSEKANVTMSMFSDVNFVRIWKCNGTRCGQMHF